MASSLGLQAPGEPFMFERQLVALGFTFLQV